ncbi:MAG: YihY/virulence factor BrkB family protein [Desulfobacteraceae bacterium]|nr:YihY/virulence factor BrkB family protein [Desulfobacteraceae bacterium]
MTYRLKVRIKFFFTAFWIAGRNFIWDDCPIVAASISFVFLLAIIPFSALFLFLLNAFKNLFLPKLFPQNLVAILVEDIRRFIPFVSTEWLQAHLIDSVGLGSFTTINLLMLPIISGLLFKALEESFRRLFRLPRRNLLKGHALYAFLSVFTILLFFMANFIWTVAADALEPLQVYIDQSPYTHDFYSAVINYFTFNQNNIISALLLMIFFLITVRLFLGVSIKLHHRLMAGALFIALWMLARQFFGYYIQHVSRINVLFGSLSSVCIILLWIYYSSLALLYAVALLYVIHRGPFAEWEKAPRRNGAS